MQIGSVDAEYMDINSREKLLREEEKERKMKEKVLCVPAGLSLENFERNVDERSVFLVRKYAERNFAYRHIIPYCVILIDGKILAYKRKKGNEPRLEGQWSIGIGGHMHPEDGKGYEAILKARDRECIEELGITPHKTFGDIYIALDDTEVDRVHLGFCQIITAYNGELKPSKEIPVWEFLTFEELEHKNLETWARYVIDLLESGWGDLFDK
jgi:predicted NUDIX family phosphoesterase